MDTFSKFCFDITHVSSRLPGLSQPSFCVGLLQQRFSNILNNKQKVNFNEKRCKDMYMYYDNSHLIANNHLIFHINDYKAHVSSLPSQFDKLISIGLNIRIKIAVFSKNYTATAAKFDE